MHANNYNIAEDISLLRGMLKMSQEELAKDLGVSLVSLNRWETGGNSISEETIERFYSYAYSKGININVIKEQFLLEEVEKNGVILFHGAKNSINGDISIDMSRNTNDFGQGFYMGESFRQAALFISNYSNSSVYAVKFDPTGLKKTEYKVGREWLLAVAAHRGRLDGIASKELIDRIKNKTANIDYIIAPIADNRMYQIIDSFIDGEITDEQCIHALAATNLGRQFVAKTEKAAGRIKMLERWYLCTGERKSYKTRRDAELAAADNKVRASRIKYRGKGRYIDELL